MRTSSVSNLELYRMWRGNEDLDYQWLIDRLLGKVEQTAQMKAGEAFHKALELAGEGEVEELSCGKFRFYFSADYELEASPIKEISVSRQYGNLLVKGRVDSVIGNVVVDYKTSGQFDPERLMEGYQWRYYLDMLGARKFRWHVFVLREADDPFTYAVSDVHQMEQAWYPQIRSDCERLASAFIEFADKNLPEKKALEESLFITQEDCVL